MTCVATRINWAQSKTTNTTQVTAMAALSHLGALTLLELGSNRIRAIEVGGEGRGACSAERAVEAAGWRIG